jgi:hypothetical protein
MPTLVLFFWPPDIPINIPPPIIVSAQLVSPRISRVAETTEVTSVNFEDSKRRLAANVSA